MPAWSFRARLIIHEVAGLPIEMASAIGHVFEQDGRPVGAFGPDGSSVIYLGDAANEGLACTIAVGAMAPALVRDRATSAPDAD